MFASEYVVVPFEDACQFLTDAARSIAAETGSSFHASGPLRRISKTVASLTIDWPDPAAPGRSNSGEIRIVAVESGSPPLTELLLVVPFAAGRTDSKALIQRLSRAVESRLSYSH